MNIQLKNLIAFCCLTLLGFPLIYYVHTTYPLAVILIMSAYFVFCYRYLRDVSGAEDYIYYMGFIFTLTSLTIALYRITDVADVTQLVRTFSVAITSTIFGVFGRVFLLQVRRDPEIVANGAIVEVAMSAQRLRGELDAAADAFASFRQQTETQAAEAVETTLAATEALPQKLQEVFDRVWQKTEANADKTTEKILESMEALPKQLEAGLRNIWQQSGKNAAEANEKMLAQTDALAAQLQMAFRGFWQQTQRNAEEINKRILADAQSLSKEVGAISGEIAAAGGKVRDQGNDAAAGMRKLVAATERAITGLERLRDPEKLIEVQFAPVSASFKETIDALRQVIEAHIREMNEIDQANRRWLAARGRRWSRLWRRLWSRQRPQGTPGASGQPTENTRE
ncbi:MAG: hypothetical protein WB764_20620 [Xanthobacteraceae bacterium]